MKEDKRAVYVGRFQIFHTGHQAVAEYIASQEDTGTLVVAVGSMQYSRHEKHPDSPWLHNPFTYEERAGMIARSLDEVVSDYEIIGVPDAHDSDEWMRTLAYRTRPDVFYTNKPLDAQTARKHGIETRTFSSAKEALHAQEIRQRIVDDEEWERFVPDGTRRYMREHGLIEVLKDQYARHADELPTVHGMQRSDGRPPYREDV